MLLKACGHGGSAIQDGATALIAGHHQKNEGSQRIKCISVGVILCLAWLFCGCVGSEEDENEFYSSKAHNGETRGREWHRAHNNYREEEHLERVRWSQFDELYASFYADSIISEGACRGEDTHVEPGFNIQILRRNNVNTPEDVLRLFMKNTSTSHRVLDESVQYIGCASAQGDGSERQGNCFIHVCNYSRNRMHE
jgi:hypothetical protein